MADQQLQLNKIYDKAKKKSQLVVNIGMKTELAHLETMYAPTNNLEEGTQITYNHGRITGRRR